MAEKVKVNQNIFYGQTISNLVFDVSKVLEESTEYDVSSAFNKQVLNCKSDVERLKAITDYVEII